MFVFIVCVGFLLVDEFEVLGKVMDKLVCLMVVIVGGLKVLIKLIVFELLLKIVD